MNNKHFFLMVVETEKPKVMVPADLATKNTGGLARTDGKAPILWPPDVKSQLTGKNTDAEKD